MPPREEAREEERPTAPSSAREDGQGLRRYWNEYDNGSEGGDNEDAGYAIYINADEESGFPGLAVVSALFKPSVEKVRAWLSTQPGQERQPLLREDAHANAEAGYGSTNPAGTTTDTEAEDEDAYASSEDFPPGYEAHYAATLPSIGDQSMALYRDKVLQRGALGAFAAAAALLLVATMLVTTGRRRLRAEVDAGAVVGVVASLGCACAALAMTIARRGPPGVVGRLVAWMAFAAVCALNGVLLVLILGNSAG